MLGPHTGTPLRALRAGGAIGVLCVVATMELSAAPAAQNQTPPAPAAPEVPAPPVEAEEIVIVTATRSDRRVQDEPLRVEVVGREEIEEKALMTPGSVAMLLGETTGLRVQTTAPSIGAANVRIQGLRGRYSQLLADGLPLYGAAGDSFSLLQVPPLDLDQVEIIKGAASALYGPSALGGVVNLVSRRPRETELSALANLTTAGGRDATTFTAVAGRGPWSWTLLASYHGHRRRDLDTDGWADLPAFERAVARPRLFYEDGRGRSLFATGGLIVEDRRGGTMPRAVAPDGRPFPEALDTRRGDAGAMWRSVTAGGRLVSVRGSYARLGQARAFGPTGEHSARDTWFAEASVVGTARAHTWVLGAALAQDALAHDERPVFDYRFTTPGVFVQDELRVAARATVSASARVDAHSQYGVLLSPRVSLLVKRGGRWTVRLSAGAGAFAPTPFTEETDETGLARLQPLAGLRAERARAGSADVSWAAGGLDITATLYGSRVARPVQLVELAPPAAASASSGTVRSVASTSPAVSTALVNADVPTRTWGTELVVRLRRGPWLAMATHAFTSSREGEPGATGRRAVPLTPGHVGSFNAIWEDAARGRLGVELYAVGRQSLEDNPYRTAGARHVLWGILAERPFGRVRVFVNMENLGDVRQTKFEPLIRPAPRADGRWTVDAWAPLDGRVINGGVRLGF